MVKAGAGGDIHYVQDSNIGAFRKRKQVGPGMKTEKIGLGLDLDQNLLFTQKLIYKIHLGRVSILNTLFKCER